jgi:hypothetical protein
LPEKVAFIFPGDHARSARSTVFFVLKAERYPVNGAVKLWSNLTVPLASDVNVTFSESAAPNSRLPLLDRLNDPLPLIVVLTIAFDVLVIVNVSDPVIAPLNVAAAPFWMLMAPDPLMLLAKLLFLPETVIDPPLGSCPRDEGGFQNSVRLIWAAINGRA